MVLTALLPLGQGPVSGLTSRLHPDLHQEESRGLSSGACGPPPPACVVTMPNLTCVQGSGQVFAPPNAMGRQGLPCWGWACPVSRCRAPSGTFAHSSLFQLLPSAPDTHLQHLCLVTHFGPLSRALPRLLGTAFWDSPPGSTAVHKRQSFSSLPEGLTSRACFYLLPHWERRLNLLSTELSLILLLGDSTVTPPIFCME